MNPLPPVNAESFVEMVAAMRAAQIGFFRSSPGSQERREFLEKSKLLEAEVDRRIKQFLSGQKSLFG